MLGPVDVHLQASSAKVGGHFPVWTLVLQVEFALKVVDASVDVRKGGQLLAACACDALEVGDVFLFASVAQEEHLH